MVITVTGSTGTIGSELVRLLSEAGAATRAVFRNTQPLHRWPGVVYQQADLGDARALEPTLAGTGRLFLLSDNGAGFGALQIQIVHAAASLGIGHVVKLSALGASDHSKSWIAREHWEVEQVLQRTSMDWTLLRPHAFMQNWLSDLAVSVRAAGVIESPIGDSRVPFIDSRDIAAVAALVLLHAEMHSRRKYVLTGGEAVGYADLAVALSEAIGKRVAYRPITMDQARARLEARGIAPHQVDAMLAILAYQRTGGPTSVVSDQAARILGRPPRTIAAFAKDHAARFRDE